MKEKDKYLCKHKRNPSSCVDCAYGKYGQGKDPHRDLVDDINIRYGYKLIYGFNLLNDDRY